MDNLVNLRLLQTFDYVLTFVLKYYYYYQLKRRKALRVLKGEFVVRDEYDESW